MAIEPRASGKQGRKSSLGLFAIVHILFAICGLVLVLGDLGNRPTLMPPLPTIDATALQTPAVRTALAGTLNAVLGRTPTVATPFTSEASTIPVYSDLAIVMNRSPCFGTCPDYQLEIGANGNVAYIGRRFVAVRGQGAAKIDPTQIRELVAAIEKAAFFALEDEYRVPVTDLPSVTLFISLDGRSKTIVHYGSLECTGNLDMAPMVLCELENTIDQIVNSKQWVG